MEKFPSYLDQGQGQNLAADNWNFGSEKKCARVAACGRVKNAKAKHSPRPIPPSANIIINGGPKHEEQKTIIIDAPHIIAFRLHRGNIFVQSYLASKTWCWFASDKFWSASCH
jgi:hypothetical protein